VWGRAGTDGDGRGWVEMSGDGWDGWDGRGRRGRVGRAGRVGEGVVELCSVLATHVFFTLVALDEYKK
jgi:hypothetical protein